MSYKIMFVKDGKENKVGQCNTLDAAKEFICNYIKQMGYTSYYQRYYKKDPIICDFGRYYGERFHIYEEN